VIGAVSAVASVFVAAMAAEQVTEAVIAWTGTGPVAATEDEAVSGAVRETASAFVPATALETVSELVSEALSVLVPATVAEAVSGAVIATDSALVPAVDEVAVIVAVRAIAWAKTGPVAATDVDAVSGVVPSSAVSVFAAVRTRVGISGQVPCEGDRFSVRSCNYGGGR
jgi:hypothetical protein